MQAISKKAATFLSLIATAMLIVVGIAVMGADSIRASNRWSVAELAQKLEQRELFAGDEFPFASVPKGWVEDGTYDANDEWVGVYVARDRRHSITMYVWGDDMFGAFTAETHGTSSARWHFLDTDKLDQFNALMAKATHQED